MSFVDQKSGPSPTGLAGALIVQGTIGVAIVMGLSVATGVIEKPDGPIIGVNLPDPPPPEPTPEPEPEPQTDPQPQAATEPPITVPQPPLELNRPKPDIRTTEKIIDRPIVLKPLPPVEQTPAPPAPVPSFKPVPAKPRNNPGDWIRDRDYKASWVRREFMGTAGFTLDIAATGKVTGCRVTSTTGHGELDDATCRLLQSRARFEPARGPNGEPVAGSFSSSVRWVLPE